MMNMAVTCVQGFGLAPVSALCLMAGGTWEKCGLEGTKGGAASPHNKPRFSVSFHLQTTPSPLLSEIHNCYIWWVLAVEGFLGCRSWGLEIADKIAAQ